MPNSFPPQLLRFFSPVLFFSFLFTPTVFAELVEYDINIEHKTVNFTGKSVQAMTVGGTIPGTLIEANEGDTLRVTFHNKMDVDTSIHWHGILLPNDQDGVPYLTTMPIRARSSFTYEYPVIQSGTYWYHSHTGLQEQRGVYGALVFHPRDKKKDYDAEFVVSLSDWTNENPKQVLRHLKMDGDYYSFKKGTVQSWLKVIQHGWKAIGIRLKHAWIRMGPMDISDVGYDAFLLNGKPESEIGVAKAGDKILLRIINMSASSHFSVQFAGSPMRVIAADGVDVEPFETDRIPIAVAETFDVVVTVSENKFYELRATVKDGSGFASGFLGTGERVRAPDIARPDLLLMDHMAHGKGDDHAMHHGHHGSPSLRILTYDDLKATVKTELPTENPEREVLLRLTGDMEHYAWSFNDKTLTQADLILIRKGENVRFVLRNETMMDHPIHLHGHFFRVVNKHGEFSPLKHTVDVKAMETTVIEFLADKDKDWFFHCHILYHMMTGMARVVRYEGSARNPDLVRAEKKDKRLSLEDWCGWGHVSAQSNLVDGFLTLAHHSHQFEVKWDNNYTGEYEVEPVYAKHFGKYFDFFAGGDFERNDKDEIENVATWGFRYMLPMMVDSELRMDHRGTLQAGFETHLQLTDRLKFHGIYEVAWALEEAWDYSEVDVEHDYRAEFEYRLNDSVSLVGNYDSDHRGGGGIRFRF